MTKKQVTNRILSSLTLALNAVLSTINLYEWIVVKILKQTEQYHFGSEGLPYYYKTADLYAKVHLTWGIIFLIFLILALWTILSRKRKLTMVLFILSIASLCLFLFHSTIGV